MFPSAMELSEYNPEGIKFPCLVSPKIDGCRIRIARCLPSSNTLTTSTNGAPDNGYDKMKSYIMSRTNNIRRGWTVSAEFMIPGNTIIEGEFWVPNMSWQQTNGLFQQKADPFMDGTINSDIRISVFDMINLTGPKESYGKRFKDLKSFMDDPNNTLVTSLKPFPFKNAINLIEYRVCRSIKDVDDAFAAYVSQGYEGIVIRNTQGLYAPNERSKDVMKRKPMRDAEFRIVNIVRANDKVRLELEVPGSPCETFGAVWNMRQCEIENIIQNKSAYIGQLATLIFNAQTEQGIPRSPEVKGIVWSDEG
jgi:ATP-dependent DNA ligase